MKKMSQIQGGAFFRFEKRTFRDEPPNISGLLGMNHGWMAWNFWLLSRSAWQLNWGLGPHFPIPVEVVPFCHEHTARPWDGHFTIFFHIFTNSLEDIWMALIILIFMFFDLKGNWTPIWRSPLSVGLLKLLKSRRYRRFAARLQVTACRVIKALPALEGCEPVLRLGLPGTLVTHTKTCGTWAPSRSALSPGSF